MVWARRGDDRFDARSLPELLDWRPDLKAGDVVQFGTDADLAAVRK